MKQTPEFDYIQEMLKPGKITKDGFLGTDKRKLIDIINDDEAEVLRHNLTNKEIADKMIYFRESGKKGLGDFCTVDKDFEVKVDIFRGKLTNPFNKKHLVRKTQIIVINKKLNQEIIFTGMNIEMIRDHGFYEGKGAVYRLEPEYIIKILDIDPIKDL